MRLPCAFQVRGFFLGCGFNSAGIMLSGGCGDQLAEWITEGRPSLDMCAAPCAPRWHIM